MSMEELREEENEVQLVMLVKTTTPSTASNRRGCIMSLLCH
ncbi:hypothetical protein HMPREF3150_06427 [Pseudomonas aeruginosa]|nr:hypothetical protein HMPREF3150_06427 [Pseudomonas aeruginosa]